MMENHKQIKILAIYPVEGKGSLRAFIDIQVDELVINSCRVIKQKGKKAWFCLPVLSYKTQYGTNSYKPIVKIKDQELKNHISQIALTAWQDGHESKNECRKNS